MPSQFPPFLAWSLVYLGFGELDIYGNLCSVYIYISIKADLCRNYCIIHHHHTVILVTPIYKLPLSVSATE